ncbi:MAG: protein-glutamate O-methyltransferase CheR [Planctomycetes bacterium]|nr:protein-glutamate O-methyltransferase CheR [Planctomycetota bacterium]
MNAVTALDICADPDFEQLKRQVIHLTGLAYYLGRDDELSIKLANRMTDVGVQRCGDYLRLISETNAETEVAGMAAELTIGETSFFRHFEAFEALRREVIPDLIQRNRGQRRLRIWSAGCATGAEPYSIAIMLRREFADELSGWDVSIQGTDINQRYLSQAREGFFSDWFFRTAPADLKSACFHQRGSSWVINPEYRRGVSFKYHNLARHPFPSPLHDLFGFDLVLCRNVMIYFDQSMVRRLLKQFHDSLVDTGWLLVGHAEPNVEMFQDFTAFNFPGAVLYRKRSGDYAPVGPTQVPVPVPLTWTPATSFSPIRPPSPASATSSPRRRSAKQGDPSPVRPTVACQLKLIREQLNLGQLDAAHDACRRLTKSDRLNPLVHFYDALVAEQLGHHTEKEHALRRAIYLDRGFVLAHYYLGMTLQKKRERRPAERAFQNVLSLLNQRDKDETIDNADGLTVDALRQLTEMHLKVLQAI